MSLIAIKVSESGARTVWKVSIPRGRTYRVTTYPRSEQVFVELDISRRAIPQGVATKLTPVLRKAIEAAQHAEQQRASQEPTP